MKLSEREPLQHRFAELYVEKAAGLRVHPNDLLGGVRSTIGREAVEQSGYPCQSWEAGQIAYGLSRNPKIIGWVRQLAADRLATLQDKPAALLHLAKYGRLSMPDYERMAGDLSITVDELRRHGGDAPSVVAYYRDAMAVKFLNERLDRMAAFLTPDQMAELRKLHAERTASELYTGRIPEVASAIEKRQAVVREKIDSLEQIANHNAEMAELEPKVANGSIFENSVEMARALERGIDIEAMIEKKKAALVARFGAELAPELDDLLDKYRVYLDAQTLLNFKQRFRFDRSAN